MTVNACDSAMRACKWKFCPRVIKARHFIPLHRCVAAFATGSRAVGSTCLHLCAEFAAMRILMADRASPIIESELHRSYRTLRHGLVAIPARNRDVPASQRETRFLMFGQGKHGGTESFIF